jgi:hypothetical protein
MRNLSLVSVSILLGCFAVLARPALADCVSCGPGGECYTASPGFSANCECRTRVVNGVAICKPSGICDPNDATSCKTDEFPQVIASRTHLSTPFLNDLAQVNPLLAGAVWAGIAEANTALKEDHAEVKGTMGKKGGGSYSYYTRVRLLEDGSASLKIHVQRDGAERGQDYEGTIAADGRSGQLVQMTPKGSSPVFSWDAR